MPDWIGIAIGFSLILIFSFSGLPIFVALGLGGMLGAMFFVGLDPLQQGGIFIWKQLNTIGLLATPGFILMGNLFFTHNFGADLFDAAYKWLGRFRGGLLYSATALGAMFGFICGSMMAAVATVGGIAIPEIEKRHYDRKISLGALAIAGTLASLIPPSLLMILYASLAETSLGPLFIAGIMPGLLLSALIMAYVWIRSTFNKNLCPAGPKVAFKEKVISLKGLVPLLVTFIVIFGGMYSGIWSAIEAAPIGAVLALIFCFAYRRATWKKIKMALNQTFKITAMVYVIIIAAGFLNYFVFVSHLDNIILAFIASLSTVPAWAIMLCIMVLLSLMGCFLDGLAIMLLSVPLFFPVVIKLGYDPIWFGVIIIIACELAQITPPVGLNLYIIKDLAPKDTKTSDVIAGAAPYVLVVWVLFILLLLYPQIALWLPSLMKVA